MRLVRVSTLLLLNGLVVLAACSDEPLLLPVDEAEPDIEETGEVPPRFNPESMDVEGYPGPSDVYVGFIYGRDGSPLQVAYEVHDGFAIWEGDIIIGREGEIARTPAELASSPAPGPLRGVVIDGDGFRWPNGVIPYEISTTDPPTQSIVDAAIDWVEDQTPGVTLVPRTTETNWVTFQDASGCSSDIGMSGGQQFINLKVDDGTTFCSTGNAAHEILHALGMYHEHTRCDRDDFVEIDVGEIEAGKEGNFTKNCSGASDLLDYDFGSIMHYGVNAFNINSDPTIIPVAPVPAGVTIGQRDGLSVTDAGTIDLLYGDNNASPSVPFSGPSGDLLEGSPLLFDASGATDADDDDDLLEFTWLFGDGTCPGVAACSEDDPVHTYADNGEYGYQVQVTDGFDIFAVGGSVTIQNVAPTVDAGADATIDEGYEFSRSGTFDDPGVDTWTATVDYDDGAGAESIPVSGMLFGLEHTYADDAVATVEVTVTDDDGGAGQDQVQVTVTNVAPTVNAGADATVESGEGYDLSSTFSDPGVLDAPWAWTVEWGDGTPDSDGNTSDQSAPIVASHQFCTAGSYDLIVAVTDKDGGEGSDGLTVSVPYIQIDIDILPESRENPMRLGRGGVVPVAIFGSVELDVADLDLESLTLGDGDENETSLASRGNRLMANFEDVNGDGFMDVVAAFPNRELEANGDLDILSTELYLRALLTDACSNVSGRDSVRPLR